MAHHGVDPDIDIEKLIKSLGLGPTHEFPQGKLNDRDEGEIKMAVGIENGKIVMHFGKPIAWIGFDPEQAKELAQSLLAKRAEILRS